MAEVTDYQFAFINSLMYDQKSPEGPVSDFSIFEESEECESGFQGTLYTREDGDGKGAAVFGFLGTNSSRAGHMVKGQMKTNYTLSKDPDESMGIVDDAVAFVKGTMSKLKSDSGGFFTKGIQWTFFTTGHSLGGFLATVTAIEIGQEIEKVVTFDSPGVPKYWRNKAKGLFTSDTYWKEHVQDYLTFPNPINTTLPHIGNLVRLELETHNSTTPAHVVRCVLGTALRLAVYGSVLNLGLSYAGKTEGFWATKVLNVSLRTTKKLFTSKLNIKKTIREAKDASREDVERKETVRKHGGDEKDGTKMLPLLGRLPPRLRAAVITSSWAASTVAVSSISYVATRMSGNLSDTMQEHSIASILTGFDKHSGKAKDPIPMTNWPYHQLMLDEGFTQRHARRVALEGLAPFRPAAYGVHRLLARKQLLLARAQALPGYEEAQV
ncbi:hypothetical protein CVIRNUC_002523 [Coccomyxa viridis]|uniref:Fungal lipase-like domain-containing protein n=1 Tax=Coccomyxa viridis TaxID=1274662 RepID=A0AAV1HXN1_9CHLO|nr:hypothetical protein CVIRNUC_002523 [Coccomyxa viridis]